MAASSEEMCTLRSLLTWEADDPGENVVLDRIKRLISAHLPPGWKEWKIRTLNKEDLLGSEMDPQILNKIRYAIPTVGLARAFTPDCTSLPERMYRDIKLKLLEWPLCVGLIIHPLSLAARVRGSAVQNELVIAAITDMKPLLKSREAACRELAEQDQSDDDCSIISKKSSGKSRPPTRLDKLEKGQEELRDMMAQFIKSFQPDDDYSSENELGSGSEDDGNRPVVSSPNPFSFSTDEEFDWGEPSTKQQEPTIPAPKPHIAEQGIKCQQLGDKGFNQVRYAEAQKRLHASPVFGPLKVNPILTKYAPSGNQDLLARMDYTLGTVTHGLLLQREALTSTLKELANKHPEAKNDIRAILSTDTPLKSYSEDLLQFVCGRRAEIIEQRRNGLLPKDEYQSTLLSAIPPSSTHLFCETQLAELLKQPSQQNFFRNPYRSKPFQSKHFSNAAPTTRHRPTNKVSKTKPFNRPRKSSGKENEAFKRPYSKTRDQNQSSRNKPSNSSTKKNRSS